MARWCMTPAPNAAGYIIALRRAESLAYERWVEVGAANNFAPNPNEDVFAGMHYVAIAAINSDGQQGTFGAETPLD